VACAVFPWERQCQLRAEVVRGAESLRCHLRHIDQRQHISHSRSAERRYDLYSVFLQRLRWRGYWRAKLCLFPTTLPNANPIGYRYGHGHRDSNRYGYTNSYSHAYANANSYSNAYAYANGYSYSRSYRNTNSDSYCYAYGDSHGYSHPNGHSCSDGNTYANPYPTTYTYAKVGPATKASADSAAAPVAGVTKR
jgi:hypothetical protein